MAVNKIQQFKRGLKRFLPVLEPAEPAFATDTKEMYIGSSKGNIKVGGVNLALDEGTDTSVIHELVSGVEKTFTVDDLESIAIYIPEQVFQGFWAGVNFKVPETRPTVTFINNSSFELKKRIYNATIEGEYVPVKAPCVVNLMFWCDGLYLYCQIIEVT